MKYFPLFVFLIVLLIVSKNVFSEQNIPLDGRGGGILAYSVTYQNGSNVMFAMNADGTGKMVLAKLTGRPVSPTWSPDTSKIAYYNHISDQQWVLCIMNSDGSNSRRLTDTVNTLDWCPSWSPDGRMILFTRSYMTPVWRSELWVINDDGGLKKISNDAQGGVFSPDGKKVIYFNYIDGGGDIWSMNADGSTVKKITDHSAEDWWPSWSPDGKKIVFQSKRDGNFEIYTMNADGSGLVRLTNNSTDDEEPKWSPDGKKIAFSSLRDGHYEIYVMNADGSNQSRVTETNGQAINPSWKPVLKK